MPPSAREVLRRSVRQGVVCVCVSVCVEACLQPEGEGVTETETAVLI